MKLCRTIIVSVLLFSPWLTNAYVIDYPKEVYQGETLNIQITGHEIDSIKAETLGMPLRFYQQNTPSSLEKSTQDLTPALEEIPSNITWNAFWPMFVSLFESQKWHAFISKPTTVLSESKKESLYYQALLGISRIKPPGERTIELTIDKKDGSTETRTLNITVLKREFPVQRFTIPAEQNKLFGKEAQDNTWDMINQARKISSDEKLWEGVFIKPTEGVTTLEYGDHCYVNGAYSGSHFGTDYANAEGTPIYASNHGIVTLADQTISYGNTLIIDHGQGIFTMYLHNAELKVKKGDMVKKGDLVATMGQTGISTGPHLHFSFWVGETIVDAAQWYEYEF